MAASVALAVAVAVAVAGGVGEGVAVTGAGVGVGVGVAGRAVGAGGAVWAPPQAATQNASRSVTQRAATVRLMGAFNLGRSAAPAIV